LGINLFLDEAFTEERFADLVGDSFTIAYFYETCEGACL
jgi:hypothetical protein